MDPRLPPGRPGLLRTSRPLVEPGHCEEHVVESNGIARSSAVPRGDHRNGVKFLAGDTALADANSYDVDFADPDSGRRRKIRFYRLTDASGWLHDFDATTKDQPTLDVALYDPDAEVYAQRRLTQLDQERREFVATMTAMAKRQHATERRAAQARERAEKLRREEEAREARRRQEEQEAAEAEARHQARIDRGSSFRCFLVDPDRVAKWFDETTTCIATNGDATILLYESGGWAFTANLPNGLHNKLNGRQRSLPKPTYVALGTKDRYYIQFADGHSQWSGPDDMGDELQNTDRKVRSVAFGRRYSSYFIVYEDGGYLYKNMPSGLDDFVENKNRGRCNLKCVSLGPDDQYYIKTETHSYWSASESTVKKIKKYRDRLTFIDFGSDDAYLIRYN